MKSILYYEWILFSRNRFAMAMCLFILLTGGYALYYGNSFNQKQVNTITAIDTAYHNRIEIQIKNFSADTLTKAGKAAYTNAHDPFMNEYYTHPVIFKTPSALQALSIGQSDNQPFYNELWLYGDHIYTGKNIELRNPDKLLSGNFDLAFVFIYLLPLLIIAFSYAVLSNDAETGITSLLLSQGISLNKIITARLLFRFLLVAIIVAVLSSTGFVLNRVEQVAAILFWLTTSLLYVAFWFSLVFAVVSWKKNSVLTALTLVSAWVFFLLLIPSFINNLSKREHVERVELSDAEREYSSHLWKLWQSKTTTLPDTLFLVKPEWRQSFATDTETVKSVAYSYLNMFYMNRKGSNIDSISSIGQQRLDNYNYINPAFVAQQVFNRLASTEFYNFIDYRREAVAYQKRRSEAVNILRLSGQPFTITDFKKYPVFESVQYNMTVQQFLRQTLPLILLSMVCILVARYLFRNSL